MEPTAGVKIYVTEVDLHDQTATVGMTVNNYNETTTGKTLSAISSEETANSQLEFTLPQPTTSFDAFLDSFTSIDFNNNSQTQKGTLVDDIEQTRFIQELLDSVTDIPPLPSDDSTQVESNQEAEKRFLHPTNQKTALRWGEIAV